MGLGRALITAGIVLVVLGLVVTFASRTPIRLGRLPGDILYRGRNGTFYFPVITCLIVSAILSLVMWFIGRR